VPFFGLLYNALLPRLGLPTFSNSHINGKPIRLINNRLNANNELLKACHAIPLVYAWQNESSYKPILGFNLQFAMRNRHTLYCSF
jgi:hypothetical protein